MIDFANRWNTRKMGESKRFSLMLGEAIGNVIPNEKIRRIGQKLSYV